MNVRQVLKDAQRCVFFKYSTESLFQVLELSKEIKLRANVLAELFFRKLLKADRRIDEVIKKYLPDGELYAFHCSYSADMKETPPEKLWNKSKNPLSERTHHALLIRLEKFSRMDGFIPLIFPAGQGGGFLPFYLEKNSDTSAAIDSAGKELTEWSTYIRSITAHWQVRIEASMEDGPFTGNSLMLPVQLAVWRKEESQNFPKYNILRLLSSGAFDAQGILTPVDVIEKMESAKNIFSDYTFCIPETCLIDHAENTKGLKFLARQDKIRLKENIKKIIEEKNLANFSLKYALYRQNELEQAVRYQQRNNWQCIIDRLQNLFAVFGKFRHRKEYLNHLMLLSAACCHAGITQRAVELNKQAVCYAGENGFTKEQLRLEIENIVLLLDQEKFTVISEIAGELEERLRNFNDDDLLMRFYGTLGQVNSYGVLANYRNFSKETAKKYFEFALDFACRKDSESDIAQDTNYLHLWYALFQPGSQEESDAYREAEKQINACFHGKEAELFRQKNYLLRQKAFALYRNYLLTGNIPQYNQGCLALNDPDFWIKAAWNKYIGALEAAAGNVGHARYLFNEALEILAPSQNQILAFIRMTIFAQAFCSLHENHYKISALQMLCDPTTDLLHYHQSAPYWVKYLEEENIDALAKLSLDYWY